jgi:hypothetical protein
MACGRGEGAMLSIESLMRGLLFNFQAGFLSHAGEHFRFRPESLGGLENRPLLSAGEQPTAHSEERSQTSLSQ